MHQTAKRKLNQKNCRMCEKEDDCLLIMFPLYFYRASLSALVCSRSTDLRLLFSFSWDIVWLGAPSCCLGISLLFMGWRSFISIIGNNLFYVESSNALIQSEDKLPTAARYLPVGSTRPPWYPALFRHRQEETRKILSHKRVLESCSQHFPQPVNSPQYCLCLHQFSRRIENSLTLNT